MAEVVVEQVAEDTTDTPVAEVVTTEIETKDTAPTGASKHSYSEDEQRAMEQGWRPKEEFAGDTKKWVSAEEFLRRGELFEKIDGMGRDLRETKKALKMLQAHHEQLRETELKQAMQSLKEEKKQAYEDGNHERLVEIDDQLLNLRESVKAEKVANQQQAMQPDPRFVHWVEQNSWYTQDEELRGFGDEIGVAYARMHPEKDPDEVLHYVEKRVRTAFPEKFTNPNRTRPSTVSTGTTPRTVKSGDDYQLTDDERRVMNTFVRQGIMTKEEYITDLKKVKGV